MARPSKRTLWGPLTRWGPAQAVLLESGTGSCYGGCGWIQVIQDRLSPSVRPILDYLFLEAANGSPPNEDGSWDSACAPSWQSGLGLLGQQKPGDCVELSLLGLDLASRPDCFSVSEEGYLQQSTLPLQVYVLKRPHVDEFLRRMGELFECVLFTASLAKVPDGRRG